MTRAFVTKHLRIEKNGTYKYRRRVPADLQPILGKKEFVKVLGRSQAEAMQNYAPYHDCIEELLRSTHPTSDAAEMMAIKRSIEAQFAEQNADPYSEGRTEDERTARKETADRILNKYIVDPDTGHPDPEELTQQDSAMVAALLGGVHTIEVELSIKAAHQFYLAEKKEPDPYKRKKQIQRFKRSETEILRVTKQDIPISRLQRSHARSIRDNLLKRMTVESAKRNINDIKAVLSLAIREHDLNISNPFAKLEYPKPLDAAVDRRHPLPDNVITDMYKDLDDNQMLQDIWALLHHTGAQNAEILGLKSKHLKVDSDIPYFEIKPEGLRTVKVQSRIRNVPLVGYALKVTKRLSENTGPEDDLFPKYAATSRHDSFSQAVRNRLRKYTQDPKHTVYSLRHTMKDALRNSGAGERVELSILGHASERTSAAQYGSSMSLMDMHNALKRIRFAVSSKP